jgi:hypothetical protein
MNAALLSDNQKERDCLKVLDINEIIMGHVYPLLGNGSVNTFSQHKGTRQ